MLHSFCGELLELVNGKPYDYKKFMECKDVKEIVNATRDFQTRVYEIVKKHSPKKPEELPPSYNVDETCELVKLEMAIDYLWAIFYYCKNMPENACELLKKLSWLFMDINREEPFKNLHDKVC